MRATLLLVGCLVLALAGCGKTPVSSNAPPLKKELLVGKWKSNSDITFVTGYDFAADGTFQMTVQGVDQPIPGKYAWGTGRALDLEYQLSPELRQKYDEAVKAFKEKVKQQPGLAQPSMLHSLREELPARETVAVGLSENPPLLIITLEGGAYTQEFVPAR